MGSQAAYSIHRFCWPVFIDLRLHDLFCDAVFVWMLGCFNASLGGTQSKSFSDRLVCRESDHSDADHSYHSDKQNSVSAKLGILAAARDVSRHYDGRNHFAIYAGWNVPGIYCATGLVLARARAFSSWLRGTDSSGKNVAIKQEMDLGQLGRVLKVC